jgi:hypothetical protein
MTNISEEKVEIHGSEWKLADIRESIAYCKPYSWNKQLWTARDALVDRNGRRTSLYVGQNYDPAKVDLVKGGWDHDHCEICWWELYESEDTEHGTGFTNGQDWLCIECHTKFIAPSGDKVGDHGV